MSSRPITNLERILASINLQEDEVVLTPDPLIARGHGPVFNFNQIPTPNQEDTDSQDDEEEEEDEFFTASPGSSYAGSSDDVPLTVELLTSGTQVQTSSGLRNVWNAQPESRQKGIVKRCQRSNSSRDSIKKHGLPITIPATAQSVLHYDSNSDGSDVYQERERNKKRKLKKRQNGNDEKRGKVNDEKK